MSAQSYLSAIEQLITQNETLKSANRRLTSLCEDILDDVVGIFTQFFPTIQPYDSESIFKAGQEICVYYRKELLIIKTQLCKSLLQVLNLYGLQVQDDLDDIGLDNLKDFIAVMKTGKGGLLEELTNVHSQLEEIEQAKSHLERESNNKQLEIKKLCIELLEKQSQLHSTKSTNQILTLQIGNMTKQLARSNDEYQTLEAEFTSVEGQLSLIKAANHDLRRQVLSLEKEKINNRFLPDQRI